MVEALHKGSFIDKLSFYRQPRLWPAIFSFKLNTQIQSAQIKNTQMQSAQIKNTQIQRQFLLDKLSFYRQPLEAEAKESYFLKDNFMFLSKIYLSIPEYQR